MASHRGLPEIRGQLRYVADRVAGGEERTHDSVPGPSTNATASMPDSQMKQWRVNCAGVHLMLFSECPPIYASCMTISGGRTEQCVIIGFGELAAVD